MIEIEVEMDSDVLAAEAVNNTVSSFYQLIMKESEVKIPMIFLTGKHCSTDRADYGTGKP